MASLAILQRLDGLERLIRNSHYSHPERQLVNDQSSQLISLENLGSPSLEKTEGVVNYYINIEAVLSWPVFQDQNFDRRLDLKRFLQSRPSGSDQPPLTLTADFEVNGAGQLLQHFLDNVHIYNPVLEVAKVKEYMRHAGLNGLGWDAQSCLLVSQDSLLSKQNELTDLALGVCPWMPHQLAREQSLREFFYHTPIW